MPVTIDVALVDAELDTALERLASSNDTYRALLALRRTSARPGPHRLQPLRHRSNAFELGESR